MFDAGRRFGRLFLLLLMAVGSAGAQNPATTTVQDTVYRADGSTAEGTLLISWPPFTTAAGQAVAGGTLNVTLGANGALTVQLVPNINATPANTVYTVVYQLNDGTNKTEYWVVPVNSPATLAEVRTTLGTNGTATQLATQQYVTAAVAPKANDNAVVHLGGAETITGTKQFSVSPSFPTPVQATDAANKSYVDLAVENTGSGSYVSKAGDVMTGPLTLPGAPVAALQAADKGYVDSSAATKADLVSGKVPTGELGSGTANNGMCLHGDGTWSACGTSSNAISIQGIPVGTTAPTDSQVITYSAALGQYVPKVGSGITVGMQAVKYATDFAWSVSPSGNLTAGQQTISLTACPLGVTGTEPQYYVYVTGATSEAALVTGGTCAGNGQAGTLQFTTLNSYSAGYTVSSASGGLQEALIAARITPTNPL